MGPIIIVERMWKKNRKPITPEEMKEYTRWSDEVHLPDLLNGTGMTQVTRFRNKDGSGVMHIQEFESQEALEKYAVSERRKELIRDSEAHYPDGADPNYFFDARTTKIYIPIASTSRK